jgi:hypothetical protein
MEDSAARRATPSGKRGTPLDEKVPVLIVRNRQRVTGDAILADLTAPTISAELIPMLAPDDRAPGHHHQPAGNPAQRQVNNSQRE